MNIPNFLTIVRIILIPCFLVPLLMKIKIGGIEDGGSLIAGFIFVIAAITDVLDGTIARAYGQVTDTGKYLDPFSDKLLVGSALIILLVLDRFPFTLWIGIIITAIIFLREVSVTVLRTLAKRKNIIIAASPWGRAKMFFQMAALIGIFILTPIFPQGNSYFLYSIYIQQFLLVLATIMTIISGVDYFVKSKTLLQTEDQRLKT